MRWLAGGRVEPEAGWLDRTPDGKTSLDEPLGKTDSEIQSHGVHHIAVFNGVKRFHRRRQKMMTSSESPDAKDSPADGGRTQPEKGPAADPPVVISSDTLLAGHAEIHIRHRGEVYRLSLTRAGKLILHK